jgi:Ca2+-binding RTX toxin-like protein
MSGLTLGIGDDVVTNTKILGSLQLASGDNKVTNSGTLAGITAGSDDDVLTNTKAITGSVDLGNGKNVLTNSGSIGGTLTLGSGDDTVTSTGSIGGNIHLGSGNDTFVSGNGAETVIDQAGDDSYKLGGGNDTFFLIGSGKDTIDGGAGQDTLGVGGAPQVFHFNLDTKAVTFNGTKVDAGTALNVFTGETATIKSFESVEGGIFGDVIFGGAAAEILNGDKGDDVIAGGLGADHLLGGAGIDTFVYFQTKDSGTTKATRDTIEDFQSAGSGGLDLIDLSGIDANTKTSTNINQGFDYIGPNTAFHSKAGELRTVVQGHDTIVEGDVNGDGKADFSILVVGVTNLTGADFVP